MKVILLLSLMSISWVSAWRVDRRCLKEGELLVGEEVDQEMFENGGVHEEYLYDESDAGDNEDVMYQNQTMSTRRLQSGTFNLKLYWRRGYCWQDEWIERKWCMECRRNCNNGDVLELQSCKRTWKQRFRWEGGKLKIASRNMCLTRSGNSLRLRSCGGGNQGFRGLTNSGGFRLRPSGSSKCLSQHHHPKAGEVIELVNCALAAQHKTDKWNVYWGSAGGGGGGGDDDDNDGDEDDDDDDNNGGDGGSGGGGGKQLADGNKNCRPSNRCDQCEGDCDTDDDCRGSYRCFQRFGRTALDPVPGCSGTGFRGRDYCY